jgi:hypothetical protein
MFSAHVMGRRRRAALPPQLARRGSPRALGRCDFALTKQRRWLGSTCYCRRVLCTVLGRREREGGAGPSQASPCPVVLIAALARLWERKWSGNGEATAVGLQVTSAAGREAGCGTASMYSRRRWRRACVHSQPENKSDVKAGGWRELLSCRRLCDRCYAHLPSPRHSLVGRMRVRVCCARGVSRRRVTDGLRPDRAHLVGYQPSAVSLRPAALLLFCCELPPVKIKASCSPTLKQGGREGGRRERGREWCSDQTRPEDSTPDSLR